ncbi:hypothetical protein GCM10027181_32320 [Rheinheimera gaetbuli]
MRAIYVAVCTVEFVSIQYTILLEALPSDIKDIINTAFKNELETEACDGTGVSIP